MLAVLADQSMSHIMRKPVYAISQQQGRFGCVLAQFYTSITLPMKVWLPVKNRIELPHDKTNPPSLIRVFPIRLKKAWVLSYPLSAQWRLWSDWADAQADLSLCWSQSFCWFCYEAAQMLTAWGPGFLTMINLFISHIMRKPVFRVCNQVRLKTACTASETS